MPAKSKPLSHSDLAEELFARVEYDQGCAFISDGWAGIATDAEVVEIAEISLHHHRKAVRILERFIKKNKSRLEGKEKPNG